MKIGFIFFRNLLISINKFTLKKINQSIDFILKSYKFARLKKSYNIQNNDDEGRKHFATSGEIICRKGF